MNPFSDDLPSQVAEAAGGVRQLTILGPTLFVVYINDLAGNMSIDHLVYSGHLNFIAHPPESKRLPSNLLGLGVNPQPYQK